MEHRGPRNRAQWTQIQRISYFGQSRFNSCKSFFRFYGILLGKFFWKKSSLWHTVTGPSEVFLGTFLLSVFALSIGGGGGVCFLPLPSSRLIFRYLLGWACFLEFFKNSNRSTRLMDGTVYSERKFYCLIHFILFLYSNEDKSTKNNGWEFFKRLKSHQNHLKCPWKRSSAGKLLYYEKCRANEGALYEVRS